MDTDTVTQVDSIDFSWNSLFPPTPSSPHVPYCMMKGPLLSLSTYLFALYLQYQRFGENLTATVLRSLEITNFVDMVSPLFQILQL